MFPPPPGLDKAAGKSWPREFYKIQSAIILAHEIDAQTKSSHSSSSRIERYSFRNLSHCEIIIFRTNINYTHKFICYRIRSPTMQY